MGEPQIKSEIKSEFKPEPDALASPASFEDDDIYEDAGDLIFNTDPKFQQLYLSRVPKYVWDAWEKMDDDAEIQIGTIRLTNVPGDNGQLKQTMSMLLDSNIAQHQTIPKEYNLEATDQAVKNTFLFSEQDLPGYKSKSRMKFDLASANMPSRLTRPKQERPTFKKAYDPNKKSEPYVRKAIPKRTTLQGAIKTEVNCIAVPNDESDRLIAMMTLDAMRPKKLTRYIIDPAKEGITLVDPGTNQASKVFSNFIKIHNKPTSGKGQAIKTARMPENELLDRLFALFREYKYWPMKGLRARTQQPEVYLKELLLKIAVLQKSGTFSNYWTLKPENRPENYEAIGDTATVGAGEEDIDMADDDDGDDDADVKFEDVA